MINLVFTPPSFTPIKLQQTCKNSHGRSTRKHHYKRPTIFCSQILEQSGCNERFLMGQVKAMMVIKNSIVDSMLRVWLEEKEKRIQNEIRERQITIVKFKQAELEKEIRRLEKELEKLHDLPKDTINKLRLKFLRSLGPNDYNSADISTIKAGERAIEKLIVRYLDALRQTAFSFSKSSGCDPDDLLIEVLVDFRRAIELISVKDLFIGDGTLYGYSRNAVKGAMINYARKQRYKKHEILSLDRPSSRYVEDGSTLKELIPAESPLPCDIVDSGLRRESLLEVIDSLIKDPQIKEIICLNYGLLDERPLSFRELDERFRFDDGKSYKLFRKGIDILRNNQSELNQLKDDFELAPQEQGLIQEKQGEYSELTNPVGGFTNPMVSSSNHSETPLLEKPEHLIGDLEPPSQVQSDIKKNKSKQPKPRKVDTGGSEWITEGGRAILASRFPGELSNGEMQTLFGKVSVLKEISPPLDWRIICAIYEHLLFRRQLTDLSDRDKATLEILKNKKVFDIVVDEIKKIILQRLKDYTKSTRKTFEPFPLLELNSLKEFDSGLGLTQI